MFEKIKSRITFNVIIVIISIIATFGWIYVVIDNFNQDKNRQEIIVKALIDLKSAETKNIASHLVIKGRLVIVETNIENINKDIEKVKELIANKNPVIIIPKEIVGN